MSVVNQIHWFEYLTLLLFLNLKRPNSFVLSIKYLYNLEA